MPIFLRYLFGYLLGIGLFYGIIPWGLYGLHRALPLPSHLPVMLRGVLAGACFGFGLALAVSSNLVLRRIGQGGPTDGFGIAVTPRTRHLVVEGPYRLTRNPMAFGTWLCYVAMGLGLDTPLLVLFLLLLVPVIRAYIRRFEERRLAADFGQEYEAYRAEVPMFFPLPRRRKRSV